MVFPLGLRSFLAPTEWFGRTILVDDEGEPIGLRPILSTDPRLESVRKKSSVGRWIAAASAFGLAYRHFRAYRLAISCENTDRTELMRKVNKNMESFGLFEGDSLLDTPFCFLHEMKLLATCGYNTLFHNSIEYEFGYRWFHQTQYNSDFKQEYLSFLDVEPVAGSVENFRNDCLNLDIEQPPSRSMVEVHGKEESATVIAVKAVSDAFDITTSIGEKNGFPFNQKSLDHAELVVNQAACILCADRSFMHLKKRAYQFRDSELGYAGACCSAVCDVGPDAVDLARASQRFLDQLFTGGECAREIPSIKASLLAGLSSQTSALKNVGVLHPFDIAPPRVPEPEELVLLPEKGFKSLPLQNSLAGYHMEWFDLHPATDVG
jgi:hypothetical protein